MPMLLILLQNPVAIVLLLGFLLKKLKFPHKKLLKKLKFPHKNILKYHNYSSK